METIKRWLRIDWVNRAVRMFVISFVTMFGAGAVGFLHQVTEWASSEGQRPFPDATSLAYLGVSALIAATLAAGNLLWNGIEQALGKGMLRRVE